MSFRFTLISCASASSVPGYGEFYDTKTLGTIFHEFLARLGSGLGGQRVAGGPSFIKGAHTVNISGGNFNVGSQHNYSVETAVESILKAIPNYRGIHAANVGKATEGTGPRFPEWKEFRTWLVPRGSLETMWGTGMPGAGKTIFASIVLSEVELHAKSDHTTATVKDVLAVLVKQTIERHPRYLPFLRELYDIHIREGTQPSESELLHLLRLLTALIEATFYFLDALDEAPPGVQLDLLEKLSSLNVKLFITSRPLPILEARFPGAHRFPILAQDRDLDLHIKKEISRSPMLQTILNEQDPSFRERITTTIKKKCGGMFLHASLQLDALRDCVSVHDVEKTLEGFPPRIEDVYIQTWSRILDQTPTNTLIAKNALVWVLCATRSLTIDELRHAALLMGLCRGLVNVEENTSLVRFVHYTAKDIVKQLISESFPCPHSLLAARCMALLTECGLQQYSDDKFDNLKTAFRTEPLLAYAYGAWSIHARESIDDSAVAGQLAQFIQGCRAFPLDDDTLIQGRRSYRVERFQMVEEWPLDTLEPLHMAAYFNLPINITGSAHLRKPNELTRVRGRTPLTLAIEQNSTSAVRDLLSLPSTLVNAADRDGDSPLMWALGFSFEPMEGSINPAIALLLLGHPKTRVNAYDRIGHTALMIASRRDLTEAATLLLAHPKIKPNQVDSGGCTALMYASHYGFKHVVSVLLADPRVKVKLKVKLRSKDGQTALDMAQLGARHSNIPDKIMDYNEIAELLRAHSTGNHQRPSQSLKDLLHRALPFTKKK
ncbi:ankyrin repeat-containing domain protein [Coprinopsis sp. MPI-PUGE-AT-0042]|nr:ankyrin repeat-containing domain protein [Coprinopsis sp. MPI-PUGE-AT-0042]